MLCDKCSYVCVKPLIWFRASEIAAGLLGRHTVNCLPLSRSSWVHTKEGMVSDWLHQAVPGCAILHKLIPAALLPALQFREQELLVNITKHVLVPRHEVLTRDQKAQLLTR